MKNKTAKILTLLAVLTLLELLLNGALSAQPAFPTNIVLRQSAGSVTATWSALPDTNVTYVLWYGTASRVYNVSAGTTNTTLKIEGLPPGTYWFAVTARNKSGVDSDYSAEASATIFKPATPGAPALSMVVPVTFHFRSWSDDGDPIDRLEIGPYLVRTEKGHEHFDMYADVGRPVPLLP